MSAPRVDGLSLRQRIWKWLKANGPAKGKVIRASMGGKSQAICDALYWLEDHKFVTGSGGKAWKTWEARGVVMPADLRGMTPGSRWNQKKNVKINYTGEKLKIYTGDFPSKGRPVLALEQLWGYGCEAPSSRVPQDDTESETVLQYAGETTSTVNAEPA